MHLQEQREAVFEALSGNQDILAHGRLLLGNNYLNSADLESMLIAANIPMYDVIQETDHFFHELLYHEVHPPTTPAPKLVNSGIKLSAHSSQDNSKIGNSKVSVTKMEGTDAEIVATSMDFNPDGTVFIPITSNGRYNIEVTADGYIAYSFEMDIACQASDCVNERLVTMSPVMDPGQTKIILNWRTAAPSDLDLHVVSLDADKGTCETDWTSKDKCVKIELDLDNTQGGLAGAETVTLKDNVVNANYRYAIGVVDYNFNRNKQGG